MDLKKDIVQPIGVGLAAFLILQVILWVLGFFGFAPFIGAGSEFNNTGQGIVGLIVFLWGSGKVIPLIPKFVSDLLGKL